MSYKTYHYVFYKKKKVTLYLDAFERKEAENLWHIYIKKYILKTNKKRDNDSTLGTTVCHMR